MYSIDNTLYAVVTIISVGKAVYSNTYAHHQAAHLQCLLHLLDSLLCHSAQGFERQGQNPTTNTDDVTQARCSKLL